jgi:hypothetical protein
VQPAARSLADIQAEIARLRLSKLALVMQDEIEAEKRRLGRLAVAVQAEASSDVSAAQTAQYSGQTEIYISFVCRSLPQIGRLCDF